MKFSHDSKYVATGDMSGLIKVWSFATGVEIWSFETSDLEVASLVTLATTGLINVFPKRM